MAKRLRCYGSSNEKHIRLNVGGKIFDIGMETINSFQYLQARLGDNFQSPLNEDGQLFVDRCPDLFAVLLQSVRSLTRPRQRYILEHKQDLLAECEFSEVCVKTRTVYKRRTSPIVTCDDIPFSDTTLFVLWGTCKPQYISQVLWRKRLVAPIDPR